MANKKQICRSAADSVLSANTGEVCASKDAKISPEEKCLASSKGVSMKYLLVNEGDIAKAKLLTLVASMLHALRDLRQMALISDESGVKNDMDDDEVAMPEEIIIFAEDEGNTTYTDSMEEKEMTESKCKMVKVGGKVVTKAYKELPKELKKFPCLGCKAKVDLRDAFCPRCGTKQPLDIAVTLEGDVFGRLFKVATEEEMAAACGVPANGTEVTAIVEALSLENKDVTEEKEMATSKKNIIGKAPVSHGNFEAKVSNVKKAVQEENGVTAKTKAPTEHYRDGNMLYVRKGGRALGCYVGDTFYCGTIRDDGVKVNKKTPQNKRYWSAGYKSEELMKIFPWEPIKTQVRVTEYAAQNPDYRQTVGIFVMIDIKNRGGLVFDVYGNCFGMAHYKEDGKRHGDSHETRMAIRAMLTHTKAEIMHAFCAYHDIAFGGEVSADNAAASWASANDKGRRQALNSGKKSSTKTINKN